MDIESTDALIGLGISAATLVGLLVGWLRWVRPKVKSATGQVAAASDAILGREEITDNITGRTLVPALPGLGVRMAFAEDSLTHQQAQMDKLTDAVARLADVQQQIDDLLRRIVALETGTIERVATKAEAVAAWRAIERVAEGQPVSDADVIDEAPEIED